MYKDFQFPSTKDWDTLRSYRNLIDENTLKKLVGCEIENLKCFLSNNTILVIRGLMFQITVWKDSIRISNFCFKGSMQNFFQIDNDYFSESLYNKIIDECFRYIEK